MFNIRSKRRITGLVNISYIICLISILLVIVVYLLSSLFDTSSLWLEMMFLPYFLFAMIVLTSVMGWISLFFWYNSSLKIQQEQGIIKTFSSYNNFYRWFLPIANLILSFNLMDEMREKSEAYLGQMKTSVNVKLTKQTLYYWLILSITSNFFLCIVMVMLGFAEEMEISVILMILCLCSYITSIVLIHTFIKRFNIIEKTIYANKTRM